MIATSTSVRLRTSVIWSARLLGALSLLASGAVHLQQYEDLYSAIPTIGTLFVVDFVAATILGLLLLVPFERWAPRWGPRMVAVLALGGIAVAAGAYAALLYAERRPLFGFMEPGYNPAAIRASQVSEIATVVFVGVFLAARHVPIRSRHRGAATHTVHTQEVKA